MIFFYTLFGFNALAAEIEAPTTELELRFDLQSNSSETKTEGGAAESDDETAFKLIRANFNFRGKLSEEIKYHLGEPN